MVDIGDSWQSGIRSWKQLGGKRFESVYGSVFFVKCWERSENKYITAIQLIHRQKDVKNTQWKLLFFTAFLTKIQRQTSTREICRQSIGTDSVQFSCNNLAYVIENV